MVRRRRRKKRRSFLATRTIYKIVRLAALVAPGVRQALVYRDPKNKVNGIIRIYSGFDMDQGSWNWKWLMEGWLPFIATTVITYGVQKLGGIIRRL